MSRFWGTARPKAGIPESTSLRGHWGELKRDRIDFDGKSSPGLTSSMMRHWPAISLYYSGAVKREITAPKWLLVAHVFNHQTHHRGQVHCLLTQAGIRPSDTDLPFMRDEAT